VITHSTWGTRAAAGRQRLHRGAAGLRHQQGGIVRGIIVVFLVLTVCGAFTLDILSVYSAHRLLSEQARTAADDAARAYVLHLSDAEAQEAAAQYLSQNGSTLVKFVPTHTNGLDTFTVTAQRPAQTYLLHYLAKVPGIGGWIGRQLHPRASGDNL
jgi:uncharacterized membrane protein